MIHLRKGNTETIYFTGTENATMSDPDFYISFTHRLTGESVSVIVSNLSSTGRYDKASIVVNSIFSSSTDGFYTYSIREVNSAHDTYGATVETGYMYLEPATDFAPTEYAQQVNEFKTYNG